MERPKESDWKRYKNLIEKLRDRYLQEKNRGFVKMLTQSSETPTNQFWETFEEMKKETKVLDQCLGNISRSHMFTQMVSMLRYGMLREEDLTDFSDDLKTDLMRYLRISQS